MKRIEIEKTVDRDCVVSALRAKINYHRGEAARLLGSIERRERGSIIATPQQIDDLKTRKTYNEMKVTQCEDIITACR